MKKKREGITIFELFEMFPDERSARVWFENIRWADGKYCPKCGSLRISNVKNEKPQPYKCKDCKSYFSVRNGSIMECSRLPLRKWVFAIYLMTTNIKGIASTKVHRELGITQKTAWFMMQRIRESFLENNEQKLFNVVEVDETYIGGKKRNNPENKKLKGRGPVGKQAVIGMKQREGRVIAFKIDKTDKKTLHSKIEDNVELGSSIYTDEHRGYIGLDQSYTHKTVNHSAKEFVNGEVYTNSIESFWSLLKRGYYGTFHYMSFKHLDKYVAEFTKRHNIRDEDMISKMSIVATGMINKRLTYKDLINGR